MSTLAGIDWRALFSQIPAAATANAIAVAWSPIVGGLPAVFNRGDYYEIIFTPEQEERAAAWIITQLRREPGPVRMETGGIAARVIARQYWPYFAGVVAAGALLGYMLRGKP